MAATEKPTPDHSPETQASERALFNKAMTGVKPEDPPGFEIADPELEKRLRSSPLKEEPAEEPKGYEHVEAEATAEGETETETEASAEEPEYERARTALLRSGFTKRELSAMTRGEILKRGIKRAEALRADDEAHRFAKESRKAKETELETREAATSTVPAAQPLDLKAQLQPLADALVLDDAGKGALEKLISDGVVAPLNARIAELESKLSARAEHEAGNAVSQARKQLRERFPELAEPDKFDDVVEHMKLLAPAPKYQRIEDHAERMQTLMLDASRVVGIEEDTSDEDDEAVATKQAELAKKRKNGRSTATTTNPTHRTPRQSDWAAYQQAIKKPGDVAAVRRAAGRT